MLLTIELDEAQFEALKNKADKHHKGEIKDLVAAAVEAYEGQQGQQAADPPPAAPPAPPASAPPPEPPPDQAPAA